MQALRCGRRVARRPAAASGGDTPNSTSCTGAAAVVVDVAVRCAVNIVGEGAGRAELFDPQALAGAALPLASRRHNEEVGARQVVALIAPVLAAPDDLRHVLCTGEVLQVLRPVIATHIVDVVDFLPIRAWAMPRRCDEPVNAMSFTAKVHSDVAELADIGLHDMRIAAPVAQHAAVAGHLVARDADNVAPLLRELRRNAHGQHHSEGV